VHVHLELIWQFQVFSYWEVVIVMNSNKEDVSISTPTNGQDIRCSIARISSIVARNSLHCPQSIALALDIISLLAIT